jgi:integrase/recombinase XerC
VATQIGVINGYGRWLSWLAGRGLLDPLLPSGARVTRERLRAYTVDLQNTVAPFTVAARVEQVGHALRAMVPHGNWRWIQRAADRLRAQAIPVRDKRARLQSPEQLIGLGTALMAQGDDPASGSPAERAAAYRDGLLIAVLAHRPMRARNLAVILCGRHLVCRGGEWWLVFSAAETKTGPKTGQGLEFPFPADLVPALHRYLEVHRPVLLARGKRRPTPVTAFWVSKHGTHMGYATIARQVRQRTAAAFGKSLSPHLFRDAVATGIAISAPTQMHMVQPLLGHTTQATSERHYNLAGSLEAGRRYEKTIAMLRQFPRTPKRMTARHYDETRKR